MEQIEIIENLKNYIAIKGSQNKAANAIGISPATLSKIMSGKTSDIAPEMWRIIADKIGANKKNAWQIVETSAYKQLMFVFENAQNESMALAICGDAGAGKSTAAIEYAKTHNEVALLSCSEFWNKKEFLSNLLQSIGISSDGMNVAELMQSAVSNLKRMETPLIILDEADKLRDDVLYFFITLYNSLEDCCGIILMATEFLKKRIEKGVKNCKKGYKEIFSRLGRKFIAVESATIDDVAIACAANNLTIEKEINKIFNECEGDFRRVKRATWAIIKQQLNNR